MIAADVFTATDVRFTLGGYHKRCAARALATFAAMAGVDLVVVADFKGYAAALALCLHGLLLSW